MFGDARVLEEIILSDLKKKFVFLSGPRQVGKTFLAKRIIKKMDGQYLLYDDDEDRKAILKKTYVTSALVCLDEFHKFPRWKAHIKGVYDKHHERLHLLLTGSARLDVYQKSGDSLFGRYYLHHLHPLTCGELCSSTFPKLPGDLFEPHEKIPYLPDLMKFGGFPEPLYAQSEEEHRRWSNSRRHLLVKEEMRDITQVQLLGLVEQLMIFLPDRVCAPFSYRSVAEDIRVSPATIQSWMRIFENLFFAFKLQPYSQKITRSIHKMPKYYFYDWSQVPDEGKRFENLVACHLWKAVQQWGDVGYADLDLKYVRDRDQREVDFLILSNGRPWFMVEAKLSETQLSEHLGFFARKFGVPAIQVILKEGVSRREGDLCVISADRWLGRLP